jgi:hypothetical protein
MPSPIRSHGRLGKLLPGSVRIRPAGEDQTRSFADFPDKILQDVMGMVRPVHSLDAAILAPAINRS